MTLQEPLIIPIMPEIIPVVPYYKTDIPVNCKNVFIYQIGVAASYAIIEISFKIGEYNTKFFPYQLLGNSSSHFRFQSDISIEFMNLKIVATAGNIKLYIIGSNVCKIN